MYILKGIFNKLNKSHVHYNFDYNLRFNRKKNLGQPSKTIFSTLLKMSTKYDTFLLIHVFKTNLSKIKIKKKKENYDTRAKKKKKASSRFDLYFLYYSIISNKIFEF